MSRLLIPPIALNRFLSVTGTTAIGTVDVLVFSSGHLHGNPTTHRPEVVWTGEAVDVKGTHHASNTCQEKLNLS